MSNRAPRRPSRLAALDRRVGHYLATRRPGHSHVRRTDPGAQGRTGDEGFALLESLVAIALIAVIMAAFTTFFVNAVASTTQQRATQTATQIANSTVDTIRAIQSSDLLAGRDTASVNAQYDAAPSTVLPWLATKAQQAFDRTAPSGGGSSAALPTAPVTQTVAPVSYSVNTYLSVCEIANGATSNVNCASVASATGAPAPSKTGIQYLRAVVAVTWPGAHCPPTQCLYVTSTLLSTVDDPLFNLNQLPPPVPVMTNPGNQISAIGDTVNLVAAVVAVPTFVVALTSGTLPAGLFLNTATGSIVGTPTALTPSTPLTLTVTDGFSRATTVSFTWTVVPALAATAPANQANITGTAIPGLLVSASGGSPGYTWTDPNGTLPSGLTLSTSNNQASITGTPTAAGLTSPVPAAGQIFPVVLTVTDSMGRRGTVSFNWTIGYPPMVVATPPDQNSTVGVAAPLTLSASGGSGKFTWASTPLPAGLTLSSTTGKISGTPTTAAGPVSVTVTATDSNVTGSSNASSNTATFKWTVFAKPTVTSPANQTVTTGLLWSLQLATTCANVPCTYALNNGPATLAISAGGLITGTITSSSQTFNAVTVTVTDSAGAVATSAPFTVTVNAAPSVTNPGTQTVTPKTADSLDVSKLVTGGTAPLKYSATNLPSWLTLNTSTGYISGTSPATAQTTNGIILTVTDSLGVSGSSTAFSWVVTGGVPSAPQGVAVANGDSMVNVSWKAPATNNGLPITGYTATVIPRGSSVPAGSCTTTGALNCVINGLTDGVPYDLTVTATNASGTGPVSAAVTVIPYPAVMSQGNGMTLWLDGADPTVLMAGSGCTGGAATTSIGCWRDKSGQNENFVQSTSANQPGVGSWNGLPAANFADNTDVLNSVDSNDKYQTVFVAANITNSGNAGALVDLFGQAGADYNVRVGSSVHRSASNYNDWSNGTTGPLNWINGAQGVDINNPAAMITSDQSPVVKSFSASVSNTVYQRGVVGQVGDVITFKTILNDTDRRAVEEYLAHKWGVDITPQAPPGVTSSTSGSNVTIAWTPPAFNGGAPVTGYTVTVAGSAAVCSTTAPSCTFSNARSGSTYTFSVTATNSVGTGPSSTVAVKVP